MKLLYDLPPKSRVALEMQFSDDERIMYCLPYNIEGKKFVSDGYTVITDVCIYKVLDDKIIYLQGFTNSTGPFLNSWHTISTSS